MSHPELSDRLQEVLPILPADGIAFRGDSLAYAPGSLRRDSGKYMIFPGLNDTDPEKIASEFQNGVNNALQFSFPYDWGQNPNYPIPVDFDGYSNFYTYNPSLLPAISWGVSSFEGQLSAAKEQRKILHTFGGDVLAGSVKENGIIIEKVNNSPVIASIEEIIQVEGEVTMPVIEPAKVPILRRLYRGPDQVSQAEYLGGKGRMEFHEALGRLMAMKLVDAVQLEFSS